MYPRELFEQVPEFASAADALLDYELFLSVACDFPIHCHGKTVAEHRSENATADAGQALSAALAALRSQRQHLKGNVQRKQAYQDGVRFWRQRYGPLLVRQLQAYLDAAEWKKAQGAMKLLLRYHPEALASWWEGRNS